MPEEVVEATGGRRARLVAPGLRAPAAVVALLGAGLVTLLGGHFAGDDRAGRLDRAVAGLVDMRRGAARTVGQGFANLGGPVPVGLTLLVLAVVAWRLRGPRGLILVLVGPPLAMVTTSIVLKPIVDRTHRGGLAFPSGHTTSVASLAVTAGVVLLGGVAVPRAVRWAGGTGLVLLVAAVGVSLVGRGYHYATDTVGGFGVALAVVLSVALVLDAVADRRPDVKGSRTTSAPATSP